MGQKSTKVNKKIFSVERKMKPHINLWNAIKAVLRETSDTYIKAKLSNP